MGHLIYLNISKRKKKSIILSSWLLVLILSFWRNGMKRRLALILITLTLPGLLMADGWIGGKLGVGISTYDKDIRNDESIVTNV